MQSSKLSKQGDKARHRAPPAPVEDPQAAPSYDKLECLIDAALPGRHKVRAPQLDMMLQRMNRRPMSSEHFATLSLNIEGLVCAALLDQHRIKLSHPSQCGVIYSMPCTFTIADLPAEARYSDDASGQWTATSYKH